MRYWWARRCAVQALCTHLIEHGDEWQLKERRTSNYRDTWVFGGLAVTIRHKYYSEPSPRGRVYVNNVRMSWWATLKIRKAVKNRGGGLKVYREIVSVLKPQNTPLQIEEIKAGAVQALS